MVVEPCGAVGGRLRVPGDKSISHRLAMLTALASGTSTISGFLASEDCLDTLRAAEQLGATVQREGDTVTVTGTGGRFNAPGSTLDLGNSGTGMRLLAGLLAGHDFTSEMTGDESLRSRPMRRIKEPLELMAARVELLGDDGRPPVRITGGSLHSIDYALPVASAQVKSSVLLAALFADGRTTVTQPKITRDHTERMLQAMGIAVSVEGLRVSVDGSGHEGPAINAGEWQVPGDFSSAAFLLTAAACREGSEVTVQGVGLNPTRTAFLQVLERMGAEIRSQESLLRQGYGGQTGVRSQWEPVGDVSVRGAKLRATKVGGEDIPNMIDELPLVAVAGAMAEGTTVIRDAAELRVKESDRIGAMAEGMRAMGVEVEEKPDGMAVTGGPVRGGVVVDSLGDHRIAMALAVLALFADLPVTIASVACIETSFPGFWDALKQLKTVGD